MALTEVTLALLVVDDPELRADLLGVRRAGDPRADVRTIPDSPPAPAAA